MAYYLVKITLTTALIVTISEVAKRSSLVGAILASLPLISLLAMFWLYLETRDVARVSALATGIFWLVLPSLALFVTLPWFLQRGLNFYLSMGMAIIITIAGYFLMVSILGHFGVKL